MDGESGFRDIQQTRGEGSQRGSQLSFIDTYALFDLYVVALYGLLSVNLGPLLQGCSIKGESRFYTVQSEIYIKPNPRKEINPIAETHVAEAGCDDSVTVLL